MKKTASLLLLLLSLAPGVGAGCTRASNTAGQMRARTAADYESRTLARIAADGEQAVARGEAERDMIVTGAILPSHMTVTNTGTTRQIPANRREVIRTWAARFAGSMEHYTLPYQTEYRVTENGKEYWIAVRTQSLPDFEQSFRKGEEVDLDLIRLGGAREEGKWEWVLLVESFSGRE